MVAMGTVMRRRVVLAALAFATLERAPARAGSDACLRTRLLVRSGPLIDPAIEHEAVVIRRNRIAIGSSCPATAGRMHRRKSGLQLRVVWRSCRGLRGPARLRATLDRECAAMAGTFTAPRAQVHKQFAADRSACGDGVVDPDNREACEGETQTAGFRFVNVPVPHDATIVTAWVQLAARAAGTDPTTLRIAGQADDSAAIFTLTTHDLSARARTSASVMWSVPSWPAAGAGDPDQRSPDVASIVQEIVDRPGWSAGNALAFLVTGTGNRLAGAWDADPTAAALLHVEYRSEDSDSEMRRARSVPAAIVASMDAGASDSKFLEVRVAASGDDAEEHPRGYVNLTSTELELVDDQDRRTVGMRFPDIAIPRGETIAAAYIQFQTQEGTSGATSLRLEAEASDSAARFTTEGHDVSARGRTAAAVSWSPAPWTAVGDAGPDQQTPNLAPLIQEVVDRPGWSPGNALAIIITGSGRRVAEAYDGDPSAAPLLHVEYRPREIAASSTTNTSSTTTTTTESTSSTIFATGPTTTTTTTTVPPSTVPGLTTVETRIAASADDATEGTSGRMRLTDAQVALVGERGPPCGASRRCTDTCECVLDLTTVPRDVSFTTQVQPILTSRCGLSTCHGGGRPQQDLDLHDHSYEELLEGDSKECAGRPLVAPGALNNSYLVSKLQGAGSCFAGARMPPGSPLPDAELATIFGWIAGGAPDN
jgi:hypothetical protein